MYFIYVKVCVINFIRADNNRGWKYLKLLEADVLGPCYLEITTFKIPFSPCNEMVVWIREVIRTDTFF